MSNQKWRQRFKRSTMLCHLEIMGSHVRSWARAAKGTRGTRPSWTWSRPCAAVWLLVHVCWAALKHPVIDRFASKGFERSDKPNCIHSRTLSHWKQSREYLACNVAEAFGKVETGGKLSTLRSNRLLKKSWLDWNSNLLFSCGLQDATILVWPCCAYFCFFLDRHHKYKDFQAFPFLGKNLHTGKTNPIKSSSCTRMPLTTHPAVGSMSTIYRLPRLVANFLVGKNNLLQHFLQLQGCRWCGAAVPARHLSCLHLASAMWELHRHSHTG